MSRHHIWVLGVAVIVSTTVAGAAQPRQSTASEYVLEEVLVTAQKRTEKLQDVPIAITVISDEQLAQQHIYSITDLSRAAPALEMIQGFGGPGGGGQVRGIATLSFQGTAEAAVGIVVDGVPQGRIQNNGIFDVQRVEVLRGPQGTLFGLTTSAGVINMATQAPKIGTRETKLHLDYSNDGSAGAEFGRRTLNGAVNIPINASQALRIALQADQIRDVQVNKLINQGSVENQYNGRIRYLFKPSDKLEMNLIAEYTRQNSENGGNPAFTYVTATPALATALAACGITASFDNDNRCGSRLQQDESKTYGASAQFDVGLNGGLTLTSITAYRKSESGPTFQDFQGLATAIPQIFQRGSVGSARQVSQELRILSPSAQKLEYVAGVFFSDYQSTNDSGATRGNANVALNDGFFVGIQTPGPFISFIPPSRTIGNVSNKSSSVFGELTFHTTDALSLITGLRYTNQKIENKGTGNLLIAAPIPTFGATTENNFSGRIGVRYKYGSNLTTYATVTRGYKGPQVTPAAQGNLASILPAEIPTSFEIGIKGGLLDGRMGFDANIFSTKVAHYQGQRCAINAVGALACPPDSVPSVTSRGIEFGLYGSPMKGMTLNSGFIYDTAEFPNCYTGFNPNDLRTQVITCPVSLGIGTTDLGGLQLVNVPKTKFTLSGDYNHVIGGVMGFISLDTVYKSAIRFGPSADPRFVYPSHWTHGARLGARSQGGTWSVALFARNLSREREPQTLFGGPQFTPPGSPGTPNGAIAGISQILSQGQLRQVGLSFDVNF
jgi:iron complex outermembrane receptor protein